MELLEVRLVNFRSHVDNVIKIGNMTLLVGENNVGKSAVLSAINLFYSNKLASKGDFHVNGYKCEDELSIYLCFKASDNEIESIDWLKEDRYDRDNVFTLRKTFHVIDTAQRDVVREIFPGRTTTSKTKSTLNPGGFANKAISNLPTILYIPANENEDELNSSRSTLQKTISNIFESKLKNNEKYEKIRNEIDNLQKELEYDPKNDNGTSSIVENINSTLDRLGSSVIFNAQPSLNLANSMTPELIFKNKDGAEFDINNQGSAVLRSTTFAALKSLNDIVDSSNDINQIILFEEPELYFHPNGIFQMRELLYDLACSKNINIIATSHSPEMIDLLNAKDLSLIVNQLYMMNEKLVNNVVDPSESIGKLATSDKNLIRYHLLIEKKLNECFFTKNILIVEGDSEVLALNLYISKLPRDKKDKIHLNWKIVEADGIKNIPIFLEFFCNSNVFPYVLCDNEQGITKIISKLKKFSCEDKKFVWKENLEKALCYTMDKKNKPEKVYEELKDKELDEYSDSWNEMIDFFFEI